MCCCHCCHCCRGCLCCCRCRCQRQLLFDSLSSRLCVACCFLACPFACCRLLSQWCCWLWLIERAMLPQRGAMMPLCPGSARGNMTQKRPRLRRCRFCVMLPWALLRQSGIMVPSVVTWPAQSATAGNTAAKAAGKRTGKQAGKRAGKQATGSKQQAAINMQQSTCSNQAI